MKLKSKIIFISIIFLSSCNGVNKIYDSEINAIRDQTEVLKEHNNLLKQQNEILIKLLNK